MAQLIMLGIRPHKQKLVYAALRVYGGGRGENVTLHSFLSPYADRHVGDISVTVFFVFFVCLQDFGNAYLGRWST